MNAIIPISSRRTVTEFCQYPPRLVKKQHQPLTSPVVTMIKGKTVYTSKSAYSKGKLKPEFQPFADFEIVDRYTFRVWTPAHVTSNKIIPLPAQTPQTIRLLPAPTKIIRSYEQVKKSDHPLLYTDLDVPGFGRNCFVTDVFDVLLHGEYENTYVEVMKSFGGLIQRLTRPLSQFIPNLEV